MAKSRYSFPGALAGVILMLLAVPAFAQTPVERDSALPASEPTSAAKPDKRQPHAVVLPDQDVRIYSLNDFEARSNHNLGYLYKHLGPAREKVMYFAVCDAIDKADAEAARSASARHRGLPKNVDLEPLELRNVTTVARRYGISLEAAVEYALLGADSGWKPKSERTRIHAALDRISPVPLPYLPD